MEMDFIVGFVDILGDSVTKHISGCVDIVNDPSIIAEEKLITDLNNQPKIFTGILNDKDGNNIVGARISCIKNNIVIDYCITDANGGYSLFVKPDIYNIRITCDTINEEFQNEEVSSNEGLSSQYYFIIDNKTSLIKKRYDDIIEFYGTTKKLISGRMLDNNKRPIKNAEIIISQNNQLISYIIADNVGKYSFAIDNGIYDVRIRSEKQPIKIIKNFNFVDGKGFMTELPKQYNLSWEVQGVWIYN